MTKKEILKKCDSYINLFSDLNNVERNNILEFIDFAELHLPKNSNLAFEINQLEKNKFQEHAKRIKDFIKINGSKNLVKNNNLLSDKSNASLIGIFFTISSIIFSIGFYFGTEKTNNDLIKTENKLIKIKDSISSFSSVNTFIDSDTMTDKKKEITKTQNNTN